MRKLNQCIGLLFAATNLIAMAMQEQVTITDMPPDVIRCIAGFIPPCQRYSDKWPNGINALISTCRYLHATATRENEAIKVCCGRIFSKEPLKEFLDQVFIGIQHIVARNGNNPIHLDLTSNYLAQDMSAFSLFLTKCSQPQIAHYITRLRLTDNCLKLLPKEIAGLTNLHELGLGSNYNHLILSKSLAGLTNLKKLDLSNNELKQEDLILLELIINESMHKLEIIIISDNHTFSPHDIYQTIAHCPLKKIYSLNNLGYHPTPEEIAACKTEEIVLD